MLKSLLTIAKTTVWISRAQAFAACFVNAALVYSNFAQFLLAHDINIHFLLIEKHVGIDFGTVVNNDIGILGGRVGVLHRKFFQVTICCSNKYYCKARCR